MLGTIGLALISLLVLRSMVRAQRSAAEVEPAAASAGPTVEEAGGKRTIGNSSYDQAAVIPPPHARGFSTPTTPAQSLARRAFGIGRG